MEFLAAIGNVVDDGGNIEPVFIPGSATVPSAGKRTENYQVVSRAVAGDDTGTALAIGEQKVHFIGAYTTPPHVFAAPRAPLAGRPVIVEIVTVTTLYAVVRATQGKATIASFADSLFDLVAGVTIDVLVVEV